jgi:hypothetical protein
MTNQEHLRDRLLALQGLDCAGPSEVQVAQFRQQLANEERRAKRLELLVQIPMWVFAAIMLTLCMSERLLDRLHIPFAVAWLGVMLIVVGGGFPIALRLNRRLKRSRNIIQRLKKLMPEYVPPRVQVGTYMARHGSKRYVNWLKLLCFAAVIWIMFALGGMVVFLVLTQRLTTAPIGFQTMMAFVMFLGIMAAALRTPLEDLTALHQVNRLFWWPVPSLSAWHVPRPVLAGLGGGMALICVTLAVVLIYQTNTLYARVLRGFEDAGSFHVQSFHYEDGKPVLNSEIWYVRWRGTRIQHRVGDTVVDLYDNGQDQWQHSQGSDHAVVLHGQGSVLPGELTETARYLKRCERMAQGDKVIDGDRCALYQFTYEQTRSMFWVDDQKRFRRYEEERLVDGQWQAEELVSIVYEAEVDPDWVTPRFESHIRLIEPGAMLKTRYGLDTALASKEVMGLAFAVHEVQRCQGNLIVTCSLRPTEASLQQIDAAGLERNQHGSQEYGSFSMMSWWERKANGDLESRHYARTELGTVVQDGVFYYWCAMRPAALWPGFENRLEVCGYVHTRDALAKLRKQQGLPWYENIRPILTIDLPRDEVSLNVLCEDLHRIQAEVTGLHLSTKHLRKDIPAATFRADLERELTGLRPYRELWDQTDSETRFQFLDPQGKPVAGAQVGKELKRVQGQWKCLGVTDETGTVVLRGTQFFTDDTAQHVGAQINAVHGQRGLAATYDVDGHDFGKTRSFTMVPACHVTADYRCKALASQGQALGAISTSLDLYGSKWDRRRPTLLTRIPRSCIKDVSEHQADNGRFEAWLVPGRYELWAYAGNRKENWQAELNKSITIPEAQHELDLGTLELKLK